VRFYVQLCFLFVGEDVLPSGPKYKRFRSSYRKIERGSTVMRDGGTSLGRHGGGGGDDPFIMDHPCLGRLDAIHSLSPLTVGGKYYLYIMFYDAEVESEGTRHEEI
jgi:hypothetical protein